jgi:hypothetical protein
MAAPNEEYAPFGLDLGTSACFPTDDLSRDATAVYLRNAYATRLLSQPPHLFNDCKRAARNVVMATGAGGGDPSREHLKTLLEEMAAMDDQDMTVAVWHKLSMLAQLAKVQNRDRGGSRLGKVPNKIRDFAAGRRRLMLDYFWPQEEVRDDGSGEFGPVYNNRDL